VGHVVIGEGGVFNARKATLPRELFMEPEADDLSSSAEETKNSFDLKSYPNPFTSTTEVDYSLSEPTLVQVNVYDKLGNKVRSLVQESQVSGVHSVVWDGNHQNGRQATPGLYVIRIKTALKSTAVKVIKK
jgi:flagellar hook assembly protein FlgD